MQQSADVGQESKTFRLELLRAMPYGFLETAGMTFVMFIAVTIYDFSEWMKIVISSAGSVGLLLSLFTVQTVRRIGCSVNAALVFVWGLGACGFAMAAMSGDSDSLFLVGVSIAAISLMAGTPLVSQIYRKHYTNEKRGQLFAYAGIVRAVVSGLAGYFIGVWLEKVVGGFHGLFWGYAGACIGMAVSVLLMARVRLRKVVRLKLFDAFEHVAEDKPFRKLLIHWFMLGFGNLMCVALFVEYVSNPVYGFALEAKEAAFLTSTIPMIIYLICILPWGVVFDKLPFYRVRVLINFFFFLGILIYFLGGNYWALCAGMALRSVGLSGGNVLWSLWVTKFASEDKVGEYMSVHTCLTGLRGVLAPIVAFPMARMLGPDVVAIVACSLILIASMMLWPELKSENGRK